MIRVGIIGATGYTGARLIEYLNHHPEAKIAFATSESFTGKNLSEVYGRFSGTQDVNLISLKDAGHDSVDVVFSCTPDQTAMEVLPPFLDEGVKAIDLGGDFRMDSPEAYEHWYEKPHKAVGYNEKAVFGMTELNRENIATAELIANPGCYPTSVILGIAPLMESGLVEKSLLFVDSKSGASGAGRKLTLPTHFVEADENLLPYKYGRLHRHVGEMEQELSKISGESCRVVFMPHVMPLKSGILSTITLTLVPDTTLDDLWDVYDRRYREEPFIRLRKDRLPETAFVDGTNYCDISFVIPEDTSVVVVASAICNLGKGASGQALQNMNVMMGIEETQGLL